MKKGDFVEAFFTPDEDTLESRHLRMGVKIMSEINERKKDFIGYDYRDITVGRDLEAMYADNYQNFGWKLDSASQQLAGLNTIIMRFKRDRKILNKAELTRLQRQFDACATEIESMEKSKTSKAMVIAMIVGIIGTAFMAGSVFAVTGGLVLLCIILAIPAFVGWVLPYFLYKSTYAKRCVELAPLIDEKYNEVYEVCEKANSLL